MYPKVAEDFFKLRELYGPVDKLSTRHFLVGPKIAESFEVTIEQGKTLQFKTLACSADLSSTGTYILPLILQGIIVVSRTSLH